VNHLGKNLVVVGSLIALGAFGTWVALRPRLPRGDGFTDGEQFLAATRTRDELRLARWDAPQLLANVADVAKLADAAGASDPFVDPESGRIVFVKGSAGAENLWLATPEGDGYVVRPLSELDSPQRDVAPALAGGWLWFASDRPGGQGGLDLWRAPLSGERFLAPENLGAPINTPADETDPAPRPRRSDSDSGGLELWFACNREAVGTGDFDLLHSIGDGVRFAPPQPAEKVDSPFDERAPGFAPDGRLLVFSSDRPDGRGGFDLWRSLLRDGEFQAPVNLGTPNGTSDESGPTLCDDGFTLLFASDRAERRRFELMKTRTRELFPVEAPRFTLADFTVLLLLALVALLAWLARRWEALDVLYKCMVVSLLVHLLFLWWTRRVDVEADVQALTAPGDTWEVRLLGDVLADVAKLEDRAHGEAVAPAAKLEVASVAARSSLLTELAEDVAPSDSSSLARSSTGTPASTPAAVARPIERGASSPQPSSDPVRDAAEPYERLSGEAPDVAVVAVAPRAALAPASMTASGASFTPAQRALADAKLAAREAAGAQVERARTSDESAAAATPAPVAVARELAPSTRSRETSGGPAVAIAPPRDRVERDERGAATGGTNATPAPLAYAPSARAAGGEKTGGSNAPARAAISSGAPIEASTPRQEAPLSIVGDAAKPAAAASDPGLRRDAPLGPSEPQRHTETQVALAPIADEPTRRATSGPAAAAPTLALAPSSRAGSASFAGAPVAVAAPQRASLQVGGPSPDSIAPSKAAPIELPSASDSDLEKAPAPSGSEGVARLYERRFGDAKRVALREGGGSEATEKAVLAGLRYLASVQRAKGCFGDASEVDLESKYRDFRVGKTGLALLAFLGAGQTHRSASEFSENVQRALLWLVARQDEPSGHFGNSEAYSHGIATYALAECYAITKDPVLREPLERALAHLLAMQQRGTGDPRKDGGWTYYYVEGPGFDDFPRASISAWQVMALESARVGGVEVPDDALAAAKGYFLKSFDPDFGGFLYTHSPNWRGGGYVTLPASTPASMFALTLLGEKDHPRVAAAEEFVLERLPNGYRSRGDDAFVRRGQGNVYFWYYSTLALFCRGGAAWRDWNAALQKTLLPAQQKDGSWDAIDVYAQRYAGDDAGEKSYSTAMCVLMLEVYYRYFTPLLGRLDAR